jgi:hypothetical protein
MRNMFASDVNNLVDVRNVYPEAGGSTIGTRATAFTPYTAGRPNGGGGPNISAMVGGGGGPNGPRVGLAGPIVGNGVMGRPLAWWFLLVVMLVALMWFAQRFGTVGEDFKNIRMSVYNVVVITLAAMIGFGAFKVIFGRFRIPGLSEYIEAV